MNLVEVKRTRVLKQVELLEKMILAINTENESEEEHGKFEEMKSRILNKRRVVESLLGEERGKQSHDMKEDEEDAISLAKRMDRELQL